MTTLARTRTRLGTTALGAAVLAAALLLRPAAARAEDLVVSHYADLIYGAPWAVALKKGFLKAHGLDVTGFMSSDGGTTIRNMMAGGVPYAETALSAAVGMDPATVTRQSLGTMGGGLTALAQGAVDTAPEPEPLLSRNEAKYRILFSTADLLPPITQHVGVASRDFLRDHPDKVRALIEARRDGVAFIYAHPDKAAEIEADVLDIPVPVAKRAMQRLVAAHYWSDGRLDYDAMARSIAGMHAIGALPTATVDWAAMVDGSGLPSDLRSKR